MSVRVPPPGTRGSSFPRFMARLGNGMMVRRYRGGSAPTPRGMTTLLLDATGARSGEPRPVILGFLNDGPDAWLIFGTLSGAARQPSWLHNLAAHPEVAIQLPDGQRVDVTAATVSEAEAAAVWERLQQEAPGYAAYRSKTDREIPIIRLSRR
jgi:deazaflavin-dependent oxidoreductase (nitroreductase family)